MEAHPGTSPARCTPPPSRGGGGSKGEIQQARRSSTSTPAHFSSPPPSLHASPSPGVDGSRPGVQQEISPRTPPPPPPQGLQAGRAGWRGHITFLAAVLSPTLHPPGPVSSEMARANTKPAVSRQDSLALYELCIDSGLWTRIVFRHQDGSHEVSISCRLCAPPVDAHAPANAHARRRRRQRKRAPVAAAVSEPAHQPVLGATAHTMPPPPTSTPPATVASPPAKQTRKAAKRRCEVELLREDITDDQILLSPISQAGKSPLSPVSPALPTPIDSAPTFSPPSEPTPSLPSSPPPALLIVPAESPASPPTSPPAPPTTPPPSRAPAGPPPPPPWPEAYVFSTDPDRIVCRKCCNRHYNFRWYSHCFMCNRP
jgi:hypothetical protein